MTDQEDTAVERAVRCVWNMLSNETYSVSRRSLLSFLMTSEIGDAILNEAIGRDLPPFELAEIGENVSLKGVIGGRFI